MIGNNPLVKRESELLSQFTAAAFTAVMIRNPHMDYEECINISIRMGNALLVKYRKEDPELVSAHRDIDEMLKEAHLLADIKPTREMSVHYEEEVPKVKGGLWSFLKGKLNDSFP